ncbi:cytochrome P450 [Steroidobacter agaridevorans]|uniref:Cytochrome P450 n=1 Tax=Steroidobacter agaridevorans TaxID=2695856 RepID=A0A829YA45_9GAMM|nr:cytochrome P450 [Steroidobacter agaridevorans]GFE79801.1 cytochrome P450 [Steroidobacter agaridevorans]GFE90655.1 cytochrome P450 [Steroidobacter agaridevorans]
MSAAANVSPAVAKPAHVPDSLVYDFDMFRDPAYVADPHERILDLVKNAPPIFWTPRNGGHWMLMSHSANFNASRDTESFSSEFIPRAEMAAMKAKLPPGMPHIPLPVPINVDPPEHSKYRTPLQRVFSPKSILALKDSINALATELVDSVKDRGNCEFMKEIAEPMPVRVFLKMLGLPLDRQDEYREIVSQHLSDPSSDARAMIPKLQRIAASMNDTFIARRDNPQDDIISMLWKIEIDGKPTTIEDMQNYGVLLFIAGLDTVMNGIGHGVRHLARNPELQAQLRANPKMVPEATEELLRRYTFTVPPRMVAKDIVFEGVQMKARERAMLFLPAADLDPKEFANSDRYDLNRENKVHIAFNAGPHRCLGSHLARVELQVIYEVLMARLPTFRLDSQRPPTFHCGHVVGVDSLHLVWDV